MHDICFVVAEANRGYILDRIAHELGSRIATNPIYHYEKEHLPKASSYFVMHYMLLPVIMQDINPDVTPVTCFFTHDKGNLAHYLEPLRLCKKIIAESPEGQELLASLGIYNVEWVAECADPEQFKPHQRTGNGSVLVCGTNYEDGRKNPELIYAIEALLPHRQFKYLGSGWKSGFSLPYQDYPTIYKECSVYLSASKLEGGGPNSLIEAMHSNIFPVASRTGNSEQYIVNGYNGFLFDHNASAEHVADLIEQAYLKKPRLLPPYNDVSDTVKSYTWESYASQVKSILTGVYYDAQAE